MLALLAATTMLPGAISAPNRPNFVVIFCDDLGIGDVGAYGSKLRTPHIDRMAKEGLRFTDFYVASPACTPSRAALLTGAYPNRISLPQVLGPNSKIGLNLDEVTIADMLRDRGYATACFGKWHLGVKNLLPLAHGFDEFAGIPYSHDMWPPNRNAWPPLYWFEDWEQKEEIRSLDQAALLSERITDHTIRFIEKNQGRPFFAYVPFPMPHVPIAASPKFLGKSGKGLYADTILELDHSVGRIVSTLKRLKLDRNTMVVFSSDNGPWTPYGDHAGSAGIYRSGKGTAFEGGVRVPGIFWWPGTIPAGRASKEVATTMDLLPTIARFTKGRMPEKKIDGKDISTLLLGEAGAKSPWGDLLFYWPDELHAIRSGRWKLHLPHPYRFQQGKPGTGGSSAGEVTAQIGLSLFDLSKDPAESRNVAELYPEVVARLEKVAAAARQELGDSLTKSKGRDVLPPGTID